MTELRSDSDGERQVMEYLVHLYLTADKYELLLLAEFVALRLKNDAPRIDDQVWTCDAKALMAGMQLLYEAEEADGVDDLREALARRAVHPLANWQYRSQRNVNSDEERWQDYADQVDEIVVQKPEIARDLLAAMAKQYEEVVKEKESLRKERDKLKKEAKAAKRGSTARTIAAPSPSSSMRAQDGN